MKQIEEVEQSLVDYRGVPLLQCGRYIIDGELRIRPSDQSAAKVKYDNNECRFSCTESSI